MSHTFPWITEESNNGHKAHCRLCRQSFYVAHSGLSEGNMQMEQIIIVFYSYLEQNFWRALPRTREEKERDKVTQAAEVHSSITYGHSYGYPESNCKVKGQSWKIKLRDNMMHLSSFVHGQNISAFPLYTLYIIYLCILFQMHKQYTK